MSEAPRSRAFEIARLMKTTAGVSWSRSRTVASSSDLLGVGDDFLDRDRRVVVDLRDHELDRVRRGDADLHRHPEGEPELVREHHVRRVGHRDEDVAVLEEANRHCPVAAREVLRQQHRCFDLDRREVELDELELVLLGEDARNGHPGDETVLDQDLAEPQFRLHPLLRECELELLGRDCAVAHEKRPESGPRIPGGFHTQCVSAGTLP